jgi:hypothetical protein
MIRQKDIPKLLTSQPFRPFRIHTSDGASHLVSHPELAKVSPNTVLVFSPDPKHGPAAFDDYSMISVLHITKLDVAESAKSKKSS